MKSAVPRTGDNLDIRRLHAGSPNTRAILEAIVCRILMFMWLVGTLGMSVYMVAANSIHHD